MWVIALITMLILVLIIYISIKDLLKFTNLTLSQLLIVIIISAVVVFWYEIVKLFKERYDYLKLKIFLMI